MLHFTALFLVNLGLYSFRPNMFERINGFVQRAEREEECTEDQQRDCSVALQEHGKVCERRYIQQHQAGFFEMNIVNSCCSFLWSGSISSAVKWTLIAVSLSNQDFHESVQLQVFKEKGSFKTEGGFE